MDKRLCLMLVEGPFDKQRLSVLSFLFDEDKLVLIPFGTDPLTTENYPSIYKEKINNLLNKEKTYDLEDFDEIVQVCDLDGCFIDDSLVIEDNTINHIVYSNDKILVKELENYLRTKKIKVSNIDTILKNKNISLYYNSTNIDHAFDNYQNPSKHMKKKYALKMYDHFKKDPIELLDKLFGICPSFVSYEDSWNYMRQGTNSLKAYSNICYFLIEHLDDLKEEFKTIVKNKIGKE